MKVNRTFEIVGYIPNYLIGIRLGAGGIPV